MRRGRAEKYCGKWAQDCTSRHAQLCYLCLHHLPHHQPASARIPKIARSVANHRRPSRILGNFVFHAICTPPTPVAPAPTRRIAVFTLFLLPLSNPFNHPLWWTFSCCTPRGRSSIKPSLQDPYHGLLAWLFPPTYIPRRDILRLIIVFCHALRSPTIPTRGRPSLTE